MRAKAISCALLFLFGVYHLVESEKTFLCNSFGVGILQVGNMDHVIYASLLYGYCPANFLV